MNCNISPLRYPGGKTRACSVLEQILVTYFDLTKYDTLISAFFGGGSFEFYLQNKYNLKLIVNDKFKPLYSFWQQIKTNKNELVDRLNNIKTIDKDTFLTYKKEVLDCDMTEQATKYFILNRCSFSGSTLSGGFSSQSSSKRYTPSSIQRIKDLDLTNFDIYNYDFAYFIDKFNDNSNIMFVDPPYYLNSKLYGHKGDLQEDFDHILLYKCLKKYNNWILTYNNCDYIKDLYKEYKIIETAWSYSMNKTKKSSEIVIISC